MATGGLYGNASESVGLYGNTTNFGGSYFEWFIFYQSDTQPATPTGGSWSFVTNTGTAPTGWSTVPFPSPTLPVWVSIALVNSRSDVPLVWSAPGLFSYSSGLPILSGSGTPAVGDGINSQLYVQTSTTPQTIWFKQSGTWNRLVGSTLYADLTSAQTVAGIKTFSSPIVGSVTGTSANVTGIVDIANGGTSSTTASGARSALGVTATGQDTTYAYRANNLSDLASASTARTNLGLGSAAVLTAGAANGVATLDSGGTVPLSQIPASIQGGVSYQGTWNATTNTPTLTSSVGTKGYYYVVSVAGSTNLNGITSWNIGDWAIYNGTAWEKIDNTDAVTSVNGYTGTVVLNASDVGALAIANNLSDLANAATARTNLGLGTIATQNASSVTITGGTINGTSIGATTASTGAFTSLTVNDNSTFGSSNADTVNFVGRINSDFDPASDNTYDLGRTGHEWRNLYLTGTGNIDSLIADTADINGGTIDSTAIGSTTPSSGAFTTLSASSSVTLSGGTANGVTYLNGSKVLTSGSALTFDGSLFSVLGSGTLEVARFGTSTDNTPSVNIYSNGSARLKLRGSTAEAAILSQGAINLLFGVNDTETLRLTSTSLYTASGINVGIGTSSPAQKLVVSGSGAQRFDIVDTGGATGRVSTASGVVYVGTPTNHPLVLFTNDAEGVRLTPTSLYTASGINVGIGTSSPVSKLQAVDGDITVTTSGSFSGFNSTRATIPSVVGIQLGKLNFSAYSTGTTYVQGASIQSFSSAAWSSTSAPSYLSFQTTASGSTSLTERMVIDSAGNLGLGVTPSNAYGNSRAFEIGANGIFWSEQASSIYNSLATGLNFYYNSAGDIKYKSTDVAATRYTQYQGSHFWSIAGSGTAGDTISFTQAATLDANGNFLVGTTSGTFRCQLSVASGANRDVFAAQVLGASNGFTVKWNHATTTTRVNISNLPTSATGLASGDLWNDGGTLKIA